MLEKPIVMSPIRNGTVVDDGPMRPAMEPKYRANSKDFATL